MTSSTAQTAEQLLLQITSNLCSSWDGETSELLSLLAGSETQHPDRSATLQQLLPQLQTAAERQQIYLQPRTTWADQNLPGMTGPVAFFSAEFGLHESLPIYSGGLGILAGDHLKSASDLGVPMLGLSLFYHEGFFHQSFDAQGWQQESWSQLDLSQLPLTEQRMPDGQSLRIAVELPDSLVRLRILRLSAGRSGLLLLDANLPENSASDRQLTARLYSPGQQIRIRQELLLGIGGMRALQAIGVTPAVVHLNEGHCAFAPLEDLRRRMVEDHLSFSAARAAAAAAVVFTTHTSVPAGHDRFPAAMAAAHLQPLAASAGIDVANLLALGKTNPADSDEAFCMTALAFRMSRFHNAVSALHGKVTRSMWSALWPDRSPDQVPIGHITNGVHPGTWLAPSLRKLYSRILPQNWEQQPSTAADWQALTLLDDRELWQTHCSLRHRLLHDVARRSGCQNLDPHALTVGFARRFATYKRADLIFRDLNLLSRLLQDSTRPIQLLFAGKAHPADEQGKLILQHIWQLAAQPPFRGRVVVLPDYSIDLARRLVQGVDVWLNTPRRPQEASGTSGQKAALNGALNWSTLDGWWAEAWNGSNGFAIGDTTDCTDPEIQDQRDALSLYQVLQQQILPRFYERDPGGLPVSWLQMMKNSITSLGWQYSSHRMVQDYAALAWRPATKFQASSVVPGS